MKMHAEKSNSVKKISAIQRHKHSWGHMRILIYCQREGNFEYEHTLSIISTESESE